MILSFTAGFHLSIPGGWGRCLYSISEYKWKKDRKFLQSISEYRIAHISEADLKFLNINRINFKLYGIQ